MKNTCKNKAVVPTETPKKNKLVESAVLMFKSSAGECCSSVCLWKLMQHFFFLLSKEDCSYIPCLSSGYEGYSREGLSFSTSAGCLFHGCLLSFSNPLGTNFKWPN